MGGGVNGPSFDSLIGPGVEWGPALAFAHRGHHGALCYGSIKIISLGDEHFFRPLNHSAGKPPEACKLHYILPSFH